MSAADPSFSRDAPHRLAAAARERLRQPLVARPGYGRAPLGLIVGAGAIGLVTFCVLSSHRHSAQASPTASASTRADAEALADPAAPSPELSALQGRAEPAAAPLIPAMAANPAPGQDSPSLRGPLIAAANAPQSAAPQRDPLLVVDTGQTTSTAAAVEATPSATSGNGKLGPQGGAGSNPDEQFAARIQDEGAPEQQYATRLKNLKTVVAQGTIIPAVLETALNSDLPGFARAVVSRDVLSFDASTILIPRGSRLVGEYKSGLSLGQTRAFVIWTRVLRPDGGSIMIDSGGGDRLGRAGLSGDVDRHFFERFSGAILLTILNAGANAVANRPSTEVVVGAPQAAVPGAAPASNTNIAPTVKVAQGSPVRVFVAHDLDFSAIERTR